MKTELLKHGKDVTVKQLTHVFNIMRHTEEVPYDGKRQSSSHCQKVCLSDCDNWRGIALLSNVDRWQNLLQRADNETGDTGDHYCVMNKQDKVILADHALNNS